jgi:hypothetical protein
MLGAVILFLIYYDCFVLPKLTKFSNQYVALNRPLLHRVAIFVRNKMFYPASLKLRSTSENENQTCIGVHGYFN